MTELVYDALGRLHKRHRYAAGALEPDVTVTTSYDDLGRVRDVVDGRGSTSYAYDGEGRVTQVASPEGTINYSYDGVTRRLVRTWTDDTEIAYDYDLLGRPKTVTLVKRNGISLPEPEVSTYTYTVVGSRDSLTCPNGVKTTYQYDNLNRLTNLTSVNTANDILASYTYALAPDGRRIGVAEQRCEEGSGPSTTNITYAYDEMNRLVKETSASTLTDRTFTSDYAYDLVGNRLSKTQTGHKTDTISYAYNANDQLTQEVSVVKGTTTYGYDDNGSLTSKVRIGDDPMSAYFTYSLENRLVSATVNRIEDGHDVSIESSYAYNQAGIRARATSSVSVDGGPTDVMVRLFLVDSNNLTGLAQVLEERATAGETPMATYTIGNGLLTQSKGGVTRHLVYDGHGSTRLLTDSLGAVTDRFDFDAYGVALNFDPQTTNSQATDYLYRGEQFDPGLQQYYLRARYYDQDTGRFNRLDPFSGGNFDPQSLHKYAYAHCEPVGNMDPSGTITITETLVVAGIFGILAGITILPAVNAGAARISRKIGRWLPDAVVFGITGTASLHLVRMLADFIAGPNPFFGSAQETPFTPVVSFSLEMLVSAGSGEVGVNFAMMGGVSAPSLYDPTSAVSVSAYMGMIYNLFNYEDYWGNALSVGLNIAGWGGALAWDPKRGPSGPWGLAVSTGLTGGGLPDPRRFSADFLGGRYWRLPGFPQAFDLQVNVAPFVGIGAAAMVQALSWKYTGGPGFFHETLLAGLFGTLGAVAWAHSKTESPYHLNLRQNGAREDYGNWFYDNGDFAFTP